MLANACTLSPTRAYKVNMNDRYVTTAPEGSILTKTYTRHPFYGGVDPVPKY
jgi:hypothetical protein